MSESTQGDQRETLGPGQSVGEGGYRLLSSIGLGGFGEVFLAEGPTGLVAVKVVNTAGWSEREYQVFNALMVSEASFLSTLDHPSLPKLRAFFAESSRYFLVMDWVNGQTLEELVKSQGRLSLEESLKMLRQLLQALEYLHDQCRPSVVFGDLKPANVLRTFEGAYRLVDLGLATREGACLTGDFAVYSPPYSAPERANGQASAKSHDIYSLAATALFAMTGLPPSPGTTHSGPEASVRKLFAAQTLCQGPPAIRELGRLLTWILAGLHPDPMARPRSLAPLRDALQRWDEAFRQEQLETAQSRTPEAILRSLYKPRPPGP
jgi:serine/threonine protein kinase